MARALLKHQGLAGLTAAQREILIEGDSLFGDGAGFANEQEEAAAWRTNRGALMNEFQKPGQRPYAYWKFDLRVDPVPMAWWDQTRALEERGLLAPEEEYRLTLSQRELAADFEPSETVYRENLRRSQPLLDDIDQNRAGDTKALRESAARLQFVQGWHARRERPDLAAKYAALAAYATELIDEYERSPAGGRDEWLRKRILRRNADEKRRGVQR